MIRSAFSRPLTAAQNKFAAQQWTYRSDHLPVFGRVNDCLFGTENTLNNAFIHHVEEIPFWRDSDLVRTSKLPSALYPAISKREEQVLQNLQRLFLEEASMDVLSVQECSDRMASLFKETLEPEVAVIVGNGNRNNHVVTFFKKANFSIEDLKVLPIFRRHIPRLGGLVWDEWRPSIDITLTSKKSPFSTEKIRFLNLHISSAGESDEYKKARLQEVRTYSDFHSGKIPFILCGDFNAREELMEPEFGDKYQSIRSHPTQIECIPKDDPHLVAVDDLRVYVPEESKYIIEQSSIPLSKADPQADDTFQRVFKPLIDGLEMK